MYNNHDTIKKIIYSYSIENVYIILLNLHGWDLRRMYWILDNIESLRE